MWWLLSSSSWCCVVVPSMLCCVCSLLCLACLLLLPMSFSAAFSVFLNFSLFAISVSSFARHTKTSLRVVIIAILAVLDTVCELGVVVPFFCSLKLCCVFFWLLLLCPNTLCALASPFHFLGRSVLYFEILYTTTHSRKHYSEDVCRLDVEDCKINTLYESSLPLPLPI